MSYFAYQINDDIFTKIQKMREESSMSLWWWNKKFLVSMRVGF